MKLTAENIDQAEAQLLKELGDLAVKSAQSTDLFKAGQSFKDAITTSSPGKGIQIVLSEKPWSSYLEEGTAPHIIEGNPLLHFYWEKESTWVTTRRVHHPGTQPRPFMENASKEAESHVQELWDQITK